MARSLRIQSTAKPKSNLPCVHGLAAVLHLPGAGGALGDHVEHRLDVEPGLLAEMDALGESLDEPGDADLVDHLGELARRRPVPAAGRRGHKLMITGSALAKTSASPPHMTVSTPFSAPAWPPETGASMKPAPCSFAAACSSRATSAEAVVWSTKIAPWPSPANAPSGPMVTCAQVVVVADAGEDESPALRRPPAGVAARVRRCCGDPCLGLGRGAVVDCDVMALGLEVPRHGAAHDPEPDETRLSPSACSL